MSSRVVRRRCTVLVAAASVVLTLVPTDASPAAARLAPAVEEAAPTATPARIAMPSSIAVIGDSISAATGTGSNILTIGQEQPANSWSTGTGTSVNSLYRRLLALNPSINGKRYQMAANGKRMTHMVEQAQGMPSDVGYVTVEMGGNDLCKSTVGEMTPTETYRQQFVAGLDAIAQKAPDALVFVASVPDIYNLWFLRGAPNPPNDHPSGQQGNAYLFWDTLSVIPCQSLVTNPDSLSEADEGRRQQVRQRNKEYNAVLEEECAKVLRCRFDDWSLFNLSSNRVSPPDGAYLPYEQWQFLDADISTQDHFHPSLSGQNKLAESAWTSSYDFTDQTPPARSASTVTPGPTTTGVHPIGSSVEVGVSYTDAAGVRGIEYRLRNPDGSSTAWTPVLASSLSLPVDPVLGTTWVETRGFDENGNRSASEFTRVAGASAPDAPTGLATSSVAATSVSLTWTTASSNGDSVSDQLVSVARKNSGVYTTFIDGPGTTPSATVTSLTPGVRYLFRTASSNSIGVGPWSEPIEVLLKPAAVTGLTATPANTAIDVSWTAPSDLDVEVTGYAVQAQSVAVGQAPTVATTCTDPSNCRVEGLVNGTSFTVKVFPLNGSGSGPSTTSAPVRPRTVPGAPKSVSVTPGASKLTLAWEVPATTGGEAVTGYAVSTAPTSDGCETSASVRTCELTGLHNGTAYEVSVRAVNPAGPGLAATAIATPRTTPGAPEEVAVVPGDGELRVVWQPPLDDGGATVTRYTATASPGGNNCVTSSTAPLTPATECTITGLTNGTSYSVVVTARNTAGTGPAAEPVVESAMRLPGSPAISSSTVGDRSVTITFSAADGFGVAIEAYEASISADGGVTWGAWTTVPGDAAATTTGFTGLTNGRSYRVRVRAVSAAGAGLPVVSVTLVPRTVPSAPTITKVTAGKRSITVTFRAGSTGGSPVTNFAFATSTNSGRTWSVFKQANPKDTSSPLTITGLKSGVKYMVKIRGINVAGDGAPSKPSKAVTPR